MAEIFWVRHGQASFGSTNYDQLSELGFQQARWLGQYFAERGVLFDQAYTGTQVRHGQTLEGILDGLGALLPPTVFAGLNEYDFRGLLRCGANQFPEVALALKGDTRAFYRALKQVLQSWAQGSLQGPLPETYHEFFSRVQSAYQHIAEHSQGKVLVVSSGGPIGLMAALALNAPFETAIELNLQIKNSSVSQCFSHQQGVRLHSFNTIPHLDHPDRLNAITYA